MFIHLWLYRLYHDLLNLNIITISFLLYTCSLYNQKVRARCGSHKIHFKRRIRSLKTYIKRFIYVIVEEKSKLLHTSHSIEYLSKSTQLYKKKTKKLKCLTQKINFNKLKNNFFKMFMYCYIRIAMSKLFQTSE